MSSSLIGPSGREPYVPGKVSRARLKPSGKTGQSSETKQSDEKAKQVEKEILPKQKLDAPGENVRDMHKVTEDSKEKETPLEERVNSLAPPKVARGITKTRTPLEELEPEAQKRAWQSIQKHYKDQANYLKKQDPYGPIIFINHFWNETRDLNSGIELGTDAFLKDHPHQETLAIIALKSLEGDEHIDPDHLNAQIQRVRTIQEQRQGQELEYTKNFISGHIKAENDLSRSVELFLEEHPKQEGLVRKALELLREDKNIEPKQLNSEIKNLEFREKSYSFSMESAMKLIFRVNKKDPFSDVQKYVDKILWETPENEYLLTQVLESILKNKGDLGWGMVANPEQLQAQLGRLKGLKGG